MKIVQLKILIKGNQMVNVGVFEIDGDKNNYDCETIISKLKK